MSYYLEVVAPFAGAWIEIYLYKYFFLVLLSLPSRERGLKFTIFQPGLMIHSVAPFAGAWIEIGYGAGSSALVSSSLPSRERGLKYCFDALRCTASGRSLRGSVD